MRSARLIFLFIIAVVALPLLSAEPQVAPTASIPPEAAAAGKDVVHQLNNAFAKVFEVVAPSVVIIEVTKKPEQTDTSSFDDLFFNQKPDEYPRRGQRNN